MKKVLVLGATGFVGTHVALALRHEPCRVILAYRDRSKLHPDLKEIEARVGDLQDTAYLETLFRDIDIVINAFAWTSLFGAKEDSHHYFYQPTKVLITQAKYAGVSRFINLSTLAAAPKEEAHDANAPGIIRGIWPHLDNVVSIENHLRKEADRDFSVINLRCGLFVGEYYALGLLPILLPRLKTHLVPLVSGGKTSMALVDGKDIAQAFVKATFTQTPLEGFEGFNIMGPTVPQTKEVLAFIHQNFGYPYPHFSVPFWLAYPFARLMELLDPLLPFDPLVTQSIVHLLEETHTDNQKAQEILGYQPQIPWRASIELQIPLIEQTQGSAMRMQREQS